MFKRILTVLLVIFVGLLLALPVLAAPVVQDAGIDAPGFNAFAGTLDEFFRLVQIVAGSPSGGGRWRRQKQGSCH